MFTLFFLGHLWGQTWQFVPHSIVSAQVWRWTNPVTGHSRGNNVAAIHNVVSAWIIVQVPDFYFFMKKMKNSIMYSIYFFSVQTTTSLCTGLCIVHILHNLWSKICPFSTYSWIILWYWINHSLNSVCSPDLWYGTYLFLFYFKPMSGYRQVNAKWSFITAVLNFSFVTSSSSYAVVLRL